MSSVDVTYTIFMMDVGPNTHNIAATPQCLFFFCFWFQALVRRRYPFTRGYLKKLEESNGVQCHSTMAYQGIPWASPCAHTEFISFCRHKCVRGADAEFISFAGTGVCMML